MITQLFGLGLKRWQRWLVLGVYIGAVLWVYSDRGWGMLNEIIRIPVIEYLLVLALAGLFALGLRLKNILQRPGNSPPAASP